MTLHKHVFSVLDAMASEAVQDLEEEGARVSCRKGCCFCCHLLVEVSWEEARELAEWVQALPQPRRSRMIDRISAASSSARALLEKRSRTRKFAQPYKGDGSLPEYIYDEYFYEQRRPCPFLDFGQCSAYSRRPTVCRLHLVTSPPELCSWEVQSEKEYQIPERVEQLKRETAPILRAADRDGRWGILAIMVEAVLKEAERPLTAGSHRQAGNC